MKIIEQKRYKIDAFPDKEFDTIQEAQNFIEDRAQKQADLYNKFFHTYGGRRLLEKHALTEHGIWEIKGEDDNADFGGPHYMPSLGLVEGTLEQAIRHAVSLDRFYTWGGGGTITKQTPPTVLKL